MKSYKTIRSRLLGLACVGLLATVSSQLSAQAQSRTPAIKTHGRVDVIAGDFTSIHAGLGVLIPTSRYFSAGAVLGLGAGEEGPSGRIDLIGRFSLDPYRRKSWEPYVGAGSTTMIDPSPIGTRTHLLAFFGLNGPKKGRFAPGVEMGIGGGIRLGFTLRTYQ